MTEKVNAPFDVVALKQNLKPLDMAANTERSSDEQAYLAYYDIDFSAQLDQVEHFFGTVPVNLASGKSLNVVVHYYRLATATRASMVVHGFTDHVGLYGQLFDYLLHRGSSVICFDLPGHGLSGGESLEIDSFGDYILVFRQVLDFIRQYEDKTLHLFGQSMGGAIVMDYLLGQQFEQSLDPFDKVVLLAPLVRPAGWHLLRIKSVFLSLFAKSVERKFNRSSNDPVFVDFQANHDVLQPKRIPVTWIAAMIRWVKRFQTLSWDDKEIMVIQGQQDKTVDFKFGLKVIQQKFPRAKIMQIKEAKHHLVGEDQKNFSRVIQAADLYFNRRKKPRD